jgi:hypothetical protein
MAKPKEEERCTRCGGELEEGYLLDEAMRFQMQLRWVAGPVVRGFFGGLKRGGRQTRNVYADCCRSCGRLEIYAGPEVKWT